MLLTKPTSPNEPAYPGEFTPKRKILKALAAGDFNTNHSTIESKVIISETEEYYKVELSATGLSRENLLVNINEAGNLCILGFKTGSKSSKKKQTPAKMETFLKEIPLPDYVDSGFTSATCHSGTLSIFFTKTGRKSKNRPSTIVVY